MTKTTRARYTLEFKQEAVRLVEGGQSQALQVSPAGATPATRCGTSNCASSDLAREKRIPC